MIKRELCMEQIRPFMNGDLIKVMTELRRSGKLISAGMESNIAI